MKEIAGFTLAGLLGGVGVGCIDASAGAIRVVAVDGLIGAGLGALAGLLYPLIPPPLRAEALVRRLVARVRPGADDALHDRCRSVAGLWIVAIGLPSLLFVLNLAEPLLLGRVRSRLLAALAVALVGLLLTSLALALAAPVHAGLARAMESIVRRRPGLTVLTRPDVHLVIALGAGWLCGHALMPDLELNLLPWAAAGFLAVAILLGGERLRRVPMARLLVVLMPGLALATGLGWSSLTGAPDALMASPVLGAVLRATRTAPTVEDPGL